jgi:hypothetical protein
MSRRRYRKRVNESDEDEEGLGEGTGSEETQQVEEGDVRYGFLGSLSSELVLPNSRLVWHVQTPYREKGLVISAQPYTMHEYLARSKLRTYRFMTAHCSSYTPTEINYCKTAIAFLWDNSCIG